MEEKQGIKISFSTFLLIVTLLIIVIMAFFMCKLYSDKEIATNKVEELNSQINKLENTINDFNSKINSISNVISSTSNIEDDINISNLYGTYLWEKVYINEFGNELNLKVKLILNNDGSAEYSASNGYDAEETRGKFEYKDKSIIYTREYYNYKGTNGMETDQKYNDENKKTENFKIIDKNTLQSTYNGNTAILVKK